MSKQVCFWTGLCAAVALGAAPLAAQTMGLERGEKEFTGFAGIADGDLTVGGSVGKQLTDTIFALGEFGYISGGSESGVFPGGSVRASAHALSFSGGIHYNFSNVFKNSPKFVPYAAAGLGLVRVSASVSGGGFSTSGSDSSLFLNFGGGLRYYVKPNWGLRPELMIFAGNGSFARFGVGLFYQF